MLDNFSTARMVVLMTFYHICLDIFIFFTLKTKIIKHNNLLKLLIKDIIFYYSQNAYYPWLLIIYGKF